MRREISLAFLTFSMAKSQKYRPPPEHCEEYCFKDCYEYRENSELWSPSMTVFYTLCKEYRDCITAQSHCSCATRVTFRNPLLILALVIIGIAAIFAIIHFCRKYRRAQHIHGLQGRTVLSHPITPTVNTIYFGEGRPGATVSNTVYHNPVFSNFARDSPPDYLPPPSYQEISDSLKTENSNKIKKEEAA